MLDTAIGWLLSAVFGLDTSMRWVEALQFFLYDSIKILFLVFVFISVIGFLRTFISSEKIRVWIQKRRYGTGNVTASLFGAITPFCSCSSIPLFLSFIKAGIPLGVTFSFLITSPLVNEYLVVLMLGFFGWKVTALYVLSGILIGVISGLILGRFKLERYLDPDILAQQEQDTQETTYTSIQERVRFGLSEGRDILKKIWIWIFIGVGIGALIHNIVPSELVQSVVAASGAAAVPLAVILGVPMYGSCAAIIPIALVLFQKGVPLGTALSFMMATAALSLPEAIILRRAMKLKLIAIFFGIVTLAIIFTGFLINALAPYLG
jgi:uncharacterized membrane protein YraQ (UPF0718 family)